VNGSVARARIVTIAPNEATTVFELVRIDRVYEDDIDWYLDVESAQQT
jgi:hypothetical protein